MSDGGLSEKTPGN